MYTRFLSYKLSNEYRVTCKFQVVGYAIIIMIIRKIIMNYDEPAKTSVGEVARHGYGRTERPCGRLTSDPWR